MCGLFDMLFQADLAQRSLMPTSGCLLLWNFSGLLLSCYHHCTLPPVAWGDHAISFAPGSACILCHLTESEQDWCTAQAGPPRPVVWFHFFSDVEARQYRNQSRNIAYPDAVSTCLTCPL